jgi:DNA repair protein RadC
MKTEELRALSNADLVAILASGGPPAGETAGDGDGAAFGRIPEPLRRAAVREALRRMDLRPAEKRPPGLRCSAEVHALVARSLARRRQERFLVVALDARNRPLSRHLVAVGTLASCVVHPREVFAPLLRRRAAAAILVHNHPSGDATPSPEDLDLTDRLTRAGQLLGIPVLDHLVIGREGYFSFRDAGRMGT